MTQASRGQGQGHQQVRNAGAVEEYRGGGGNKGESADKSAGWSGADSVGLATEEEETTAEGAGWDSKQRTATAGGTQESGADGRSGDTMSGRGDTGKASSTVTDKAGAGGHHGARPEQRGRFAGWRENPAGESSGVRGDNGGRKASGVAHEYSGLGEKEGGCEASGVVENQQGYRQGVGGGGESPQGTSTSGVAELPRGDETPRVTTAGDEVPGEEGWG